MLRRSVNWFGLLFAAFACVAPMRAQLSSLMPGQAAPSQTTSSVPAVPADPLGRETPRGTIFGFIQAAQSENYNVAIQYFQPAPSRHGSSPEEEQELASQLLAIFNQSFAGPLDSISRDPQGRLDDSLPPDEERVGGVRGLSESFPILLMRVEDSQGRKIWLISRKSLAEVPDAYDSLRFPRLEKELPKPLVSYRFLAMPLWQWLAILLFLPIALAVARLFSLIIRQLRQRIRHSRGRESLPKERLWRFGPGTLLLAAILHYEFVYLIGTSILYRQYYRRLIWVFLAMAFYWVITHFTRAASKRIGASLANRGMLAERSIVSLVRRFLEVIIFLGIGIGVLHSLGVDVTTALAGLGIGGLAIGLGAQKTFENLFGGVSILFDKALQVGDTCKIGTQTGTVEDIGLRSTKIRTQDRTLVSIPNGTVATATLENYRFRDKILCQQILRLRYDLAPDHVRHVIGEIRGLVQRHPKVETSTSRVRFLRLAEYALEVELYVYILERDYNEFLAVQEGLLLQVMDTLESTGAVVALPSQATLVTKDSWVDPEKSRAALAAVKKNREAGNPE